MPRFFREITLQALQEKIQKALDDDERYQDDPGGEDYIMVSLTPTVKRDLSKVEFDLENFWMTPNNEKEKLVGYNQLDNGFTFLGAMAGGDWEVPIYLIFYFDGHKLRGYIPTEGNPWNTDTKQAYGNADGDYDMEKRGYKKHKGELVNKDIANGLKRGYINPKVLAECKAHPEEEVWFDAIEECEYDWAKIEADIKARILPKEKGTPPAIKGEPQPVKDW